MDGWLRWTEPECTIFSLFLTLSERTGSSAGVSCVISFDPNRPSGLAVQKFSHLCQPGVPGKSPEQFIRTFRPALELETIFINDFRSPHFLRFLLVFSWTILCRHLNMTELLLVKCWLKILYNKSQMWGQCCLLEKKKHLSSNWLYFSTGQPAPRRMTTEEWFGLEICLRKCALFLNWLTEPKRREKVFNQISSQRIE